MSCFLRINAFKHIKAATVLQQNIRTNKLRHLSIVTPQTKVQQENKRITESSTWTRIYYFRHIRLAAVVNRFKLYQTAFTVSLLPLSIVMYNFNVVELNYIGFVVGGATFACAMLYAMTEIFRRLIGIISISGDNEHVKISHLTFWGRKNDIVVKLEDIIPLSDCDVNPNDVYVKIQRYSSSDYLYLTLKYGDILDRTKFELVFGNLDVIGFRK